MFKQQEYFKQPVEMFDQADLGLDEKRCVWKRGTM